MKKYITIFMLENGYLAQEHTDTGGVFRSVYLKDISIDRLLSFTGDHIAIDHEAVLRSLVGTFDDDLKITAIKAVRNYCIDNKYDAYRGLKDAKDYVESSRPRWASRW
jgi:hypothetical protein